MRALLIEDNTFIAESVVVMLKDQGVEVYTTDLGAEGLDLASLYDYHVVILDLGLPDISGYEVIRTLRERKVPVPIIVLSGLSAVADIVRALDMGADDFMIKPFHDDELVARIFALVRRSKGHISTKMVCGNLTLDAKHKRVMVDNQVVTLTGREYSILEVLFMQNTQIVSKQMFLDHIYGGTSAREEKVIDVFICKVRKKLTINNCTAVLETVWGMGYRLYEGETQYIS